MAGTSDRFRRPTPQRGRRDGLSGAGLLVAALLTVAFGVGAVVAGYAWLSWPQVSPDVSDAISSATGRIEPAAPVAPVDDGAWTDADIKSCKDEANEAGEVAKRRKLAAVSADRVGLGGPDAGLVERATYLLCGATKKPLHLCKDYWRKWFIKAIKAYTVEFKQVSTQDYWRKVEVADRARRQSGASWQVVTDELDQTTREVAKMHDDIAAAFRVLIADGIISTDDFAVFFGFGVPTEIGAMIGGAKPLRERCG